MIQSCQSSEYIGCLDLFQPFTAFRSSFSTVHRLLRALHSQAMPRTLVERPCTSIDQALPVSGVYTLRQRRRWWRRSSRLLCILLGIIPLIIGAYHPSCAETGSFEDGWTVRELLYVGEVLHKSIGSSSCKRRHIW
jgi:hypothetical protein